MTKSLVPIPPPEAPNWQEKAIEEISVVFDISERAIREILTRHWLAASGAPPSQGERK